MSGMEERRHLTQYLFIAFSFLLLAACGGGGGGGSSSSSTGDGFSVSTTALSFSAEQNGALPASQDIQTSFTNPEAYYVGAAYPPGVTPVSWLTITESGSGNAYTFHFAVNTTSLSPGTYNTTIGLGIARRDGSIITYKNISVSYTVQPLHGLNVAPQSVSFSQLLGDATPSPQSVTLSEISGSSYAWNASVSYQTGSGWLNVNGSSQSSGNSLPATLSLSINPLTSLGTYSAVVHVTGTNGALDIPVSYTVREPQVMFVPTSLAFSGISHDSTMPLTQSVTLSTGAGLPVGYSATVNYGAGASGWLTVPNSGSAPGTITVGVNTTSLNAGSYTATLVLTTATQNLSIPITYSVRAPQVTRSPTQLSFGALRQGAAPSAQSIVISTENSISVPYTASVVYGPGASGWLNLPAGGTAPDNISVAVNTTNLGVGSYTATINVQPAYGGTLIAVGVTYQVQYANLALTPGQLAYTIDKNSTAADLTKSVAVGDTGLPMSWTAVSSVPWLSVGTSSGTTAGNGTATAVSVLLVSSEIEKLDPGPHSGNLTFNYTRPDASVATLQLPVTLNMAIAKVKFAAPHVAIASTTNSLIIRGQGFTGLTSNDVLFGSTKASGISVVSDTEIRATAGPLAAQSYPVTIANQLGLNRSRANLVVVAPQSYGAVAFTSSGAKSRVVFDDERRAVYVLNRGTVTVERYSYDTGTSTWGVSSLSLPQLQDIALSTDGTQLLAVSDGAVRIIDPLSLTQTRQIPFSTASNVYLRQIASANNGKAILGTGYYGSGFTNIYKYDQLAQTISPLYASPTSTFIVYEYFTPLGVSADGSRVVMGDGGISPPQLISYYDAGTDSVGGAGAPARDLFTVVLNRDATRMVLNGIEVFDGNLVLLGNLPNTTGAAALSPDGSIAYTYDNVSGTVRKFDLNGALVAGVFPEIGTGTTPVGAPISTASFGNLAMAVSLDGNTLVIAGNQKVVIMPVP